MPRVEAFVRLLSAQGVEWGLIGPREVERIWPRHIFNSVAVAPLIGSGAFVVDVGSGAGLPGLPLALARPDLRVTLLEPMQRRCAFLALAIAELGLADRVRVVRSRAEDHHERYDCVTCRAVAPLPTLLDWCWPLIAPGGKLLALKGAAASDELRLAGPVLRRLGALGMVHQMKIADGVDATWVIEISRPRSTVNWSS